MILSIGDVITLEKNNNYAVVSYGIYNNQTYYYLIDIDKDDSIRIGYIEEDSFVEEEDKEIIKALMPLFYKNNNIR